MQNDKIYLTLCTAKLLDSNEYWHVQSLLLIANCLMWLLIKSLSFKEYRRKHYYKSILNKKFKNFKSKLCNSKKKKKKKTDQQNHHEFQCFFFYWNGALTFITTSSYR